MSKIKIGPYCDLVAKENRGDELPYYPAECCRRNYLSFMLFWSSHASKGVLGTTVDEIFGKGGLTWMV